MSDLIQRVYQQFLPMPLEPDQTSLYVDLDEVRGNGQVVDRMASKIRLAQRPTCQVLAGHMGSGKSTELLRLKTNLEARGKSRFFVVYCRADDDIDRNDVDFPEVLIAILRQTAAALKKQGISLAHGFFKNLQLRIKQQARSLSGIDIDKLELEAGFATIGAAMKASPDARVELRALIEPDTSNWLAAANEFLGQAVQSLTGKGFDGLVIIVDDLDKMVVRPHEGASCTTDEHLFINRSAQLRGLLCHTVYSMPLQLAYSHHLQTIKNVYEGHVPILPMSELATRPPKSHSFKPGIEKFREIIRRRLSAAKAQEAEVFESDKVRDELITISGGQPTGLMYLMTESIVSGGLPIRKQAVERARTEGMRDYARQLRDEHWPVLNEVKKTGNASRTESNEPLIRELLQSRAILQYVNKEEWCALNPLVAALKPPARRKTSP